MPRLARLAMIAVLSAGAICALIAWGMYRAAREAPSFYREALKVQPAAQRTAGQQFERNALALYNQLHQADGRWTVRFTDAEINGWLATELPAKFPRALPDGLSDPRIAIEHRQAQLAIRCLHQHVDTVLSLTAEIYLTAEPNELAIRIRGVRAGRLPIPFAQLQAQVAERAARAEILLRWAEVDGDPVALVKLPSGGKRFSSRLVLEAVDLRDGELTITGRTEDQEPASPVAAQPGSSETRQR